MIISGGSRSNWRFFAKHLLRADENERVQVTEIKGLLSETVPEALREMDAVADGTRCKNFFYHVNLNPREDERLTAQQWEESIDRLEHNLGLDGHARFVVEHEKYGRVHRHVVWSRIDVDSMTAVSDSFTAPVHERTAREIEDAYGLAPVESVLVKDRETERPERGPRPWENFRGKTSGIDPREMQAELTELWQAADSGLAFKAAIEERGYILARGDRRDFVVVDQAGDDHSLARRISGVKAAEIRERMADVERDALPSVAEARELAQNAADATGDPLLVEDAPRAERPGERRPQGEPEFAGSSLPEEAIAEPATHHDDGGAPSRISPWGAAWRTFADRASHYADRLYALLQDESSGVPGEHHHIPHVKQPGWLFRALDAAHRVHHADGHELADGSPPIEADVGDPSRPDGTVEPSEPDTAPQTGQAAPVEPQSVFDAFAEAWLQETWEAEPAPEAPEAEPDSPDYDGPDIG